MESLSRTEWIERARAHRETISRWTIPFRERRKKQQSHPVEDFLFVYYQYSTAKLEQWHPGFGVLLEGANLEAFDSKAYIQHAEGVVCCPTRLSAKERSRLEWIANLLRQTAQRRPNFSCLGMHEWAMVYRGEEVRHEKTTRLRLPQAEIDQLVESRPIACSHFDAFRFFAADARPLNRFQPTMETRPQLEQPACIHANMDLYKWAFKAMPWIGSDLLRRCFLLAMAARAIDMRASPYDLSEYNELPSIPVETPEGRLEYEQSQREIADRAAPLRRELIEEIERLLNSERAEPTT